jgi:hypothetical protein
MTEYQLQFLGFRNFISLDILLCINSYFVFHHEIAKDLQPFKFVTNLRLQILFVLKYQLFITINTLYASQ